MVEGRVVRVREGAGSCVCVCVMILLMGKCGQFIGKVTAGRGASRALAISTHVRDVGQPVRPAPYFVIEEHKRERVVDTNRSALIIDRARRRGEPAVD
jgi:hypothetical protein